MDKEKIEVLRSLLQEMAESRIIYKEGKLFRTIKRVNQFTQITLDEPEEVINHNAKGYRRVGFKKGVMYQHRLIFAYFYGIDELYKYETIDHVDGNKDHNFIDNLEGVTIDENNLRAKEKGLLKPQKGENNGGSKLTAEQVFSIRKLLKEKVSQYKIAEIFGVRQSLISCINTGKIWSHI